MIYDINDYGGLQTYDVNKNKKYILEDDNILTAKTMQLAINSMYDSDISVEKIVVVRYPSINRVSQMFMSNHGAVDYNYFNNYIYGLNFKSPYSWRDNNENSYEDSLGVFDLNREKIDECLYKNHDCNEKSEVKKIKRMVKE